MNKKAFTLVELIVVITILAILGTIAFISLQGYSKDARDSARLSDLNNIKKTLELYALDTNKYPFPDESYEITYSGTTVWTQGTFGSGVLKEIQKLSNVPLDPLTGNGYTYSVLNTGKEYQIGGVFEGELSKLNSITTNADGETIATAYTTGNYNGLAAKTLDGTNCSILSIPSILTSTGTEVGGNIEVENILNEKKLVYKGNNNLPYNIAKNTKLKLDGGFDFDNSSTLVAYSDTNECNTLTTDSNARLALYNGLKNSYSGTVIETEEEIYTLLNTTDTDKIISNIVFNSLGQKLSFNDNNQTSIFICGDTVSALGETYTTILGPDGNCWTSQNMRHGTKLANVSTMPINDTIIEKWCYNNSDTNCNIEGGLYTWSEAMGYGSTENEDTSKSVCGQLGEGWKLPTDSQWTILTNAGATGWTGNKLSGIISSLQGLRYTTNKYLYRGFYGNWWTSTSFWYRMISESVTTVYRDNYVDDGGFSVICVKK